MASARDGRSLLRAVKAAAVPERCIPVGAPPRALLRPLPADRALIDPNDVRRLTEWRNRFVGAFLSEFEATEERTASWLTRVVGRDDTRILFMLDDEAGRTVGYMGLAFIDWERARGEVDAVVRGGEAPRGQMSDALRTLMGWAQGPLGLRRIGVRVRSDNTALAFYRKLGFAEVRRVPLRRTVDGEMVRWVEDPAAPPGGLSLVHMELGAGAQVAPAPQS